MKKIGLSLLFISLVLGVHAQMQTPQPSPISMMEQMVGLTEVKVEYSRPSMRERTVFGDLVPYDKLWRTGANKNTIISFSDDVQIGDKALKAGSYAIFSKPGEAVWEVIFYSDTENWGTPKNWDASKVAASIKTEVQKMPMKVETFTITFDDLTNNSTNLGILWEDAYVAVPIAVPTTAKAQKSIEMVMAGPSGRDFYSAASYYFEEGLDMNKAKEWIDKAVAMDTEGKQYWVHRKQSLINAKLGDSKAAIASAKKSLVAAKEAGNQDYVKMNEDSLKEWGAMK